MPRRATWFRLHSWLGVITGAFLLLVCWSGSLVVFNEEIGWLLTPDVRADPRRGIQSVDAVIASIRERYADQAVALHLQIGRHWAHTAYVDGLEPGRFLFIDPATGQVRRDDAREGYTWNVSHFLRQLHVRLLMGLWGRVFVGLLGVTLLLSIVTSLWIYREWLRSLLRVRRGAARRIFHMDLHKAVGLWALVFNVLFAVTGAVLGVENLYYQVWPRSPDQASAETLAGTTRLLDPARSRSPSEVIAALRTLDREFTARVIEIPPPDDPGPLVIRGDHGSPLVAKDTSSYTIDVTSGVLLESVDARRAGWGTYLYNTLDPVHFGYFGEGWGLVAGYLVKIVWFVAGLTPGVLTLTGGMMWILRRQRARAAAAARQRLAPGAAGTLVRGDDASAARLSARLAYALGLVVFLAVGYCLQATIWQRGWTLDEVMWQHWMVKPVCLIIVCFPVTAVVVWIGSLTVETRRAPVIGLLGAVPSGLVYLAATAVLN
ncbi:MAG: PepSY-associated TM helix domain-containing protein [Vicinamibacteraceae bacterium]